MKYSELKYLKNSISRNIKCDNCKKTRICADCGKTITYLSVEACYLAEKKKSLCKSCGVKKSCNTPERLLSMSNRVKGDKNPMFGKTGELNPFFGKHHTEETKSKLRTEKLGTPIHTKESKKKISEWQKKNAPMTGRSVFSVWVEKYGEEIANQKFLVLKEKQRVNSSGGNNPMYGKPSPNGSGNGYSGWYNDIYFRSLRELMFLIYAKRFNLKIESLEKKSNGLVYIDCLGQTRTYFSDFLVNDKFFVEIKPIRLWNTPNNIKKFQVAKKYCESKGLKFKLIDPVINQKLLHKLYSSGEIKFIKKYEDKFIHFH